MESESPKKQFSPVPVPSGTTLSGNLTGIPRRIRDSCVDFYNSVQIWNSHTISGVNILKELINVKLCLINAKEEKNDDEFLTTNSTRLQELCDEIHALVIKLENEVSKMKKIETELRALKDLEKLQFPVDPYAGDANRMQRPIFQTWPIEKFSDTVLELLYIYQKELEVKKNVAQEIAHMEDENSLSFFVGVWTYECYTGDESKLHLITMINETSFNK